jgi:hypothetical protein
MTDTIIVTPITQAVTVSSSGPQGATGATGAKGDTGATGSSGVVSVTAPVTNSGTSTAAILGLDQTALAITPSQVSGTAVITTDSRLSDARTPTTHASSHASGGSDAVTLAQSQVTGLTSALSGKAGLASANAFTVGGQTITNDVATNVPLQITAITSQSANLTEWRNATPLVVSRVSSTGQIATGTNMAVGSTSITPLNMFQVTCTAATQLGAVIKGAASQSANLQEWQDSGGTAQTLIGSSGQIATSQRITIGSTTISTAGQLAVILGVDRVALAVRATSSQTADLQQYQNSAGTVLGGRNANAQAFTGTTVPLFTAVGGTIQSIATGTNPLITMASAHGLSVGDLVQIAGTTGSTYNGTNFYVSIVPSTTTFNIISGLTVGQASAAGTVALPAQKSITPKSAGTVGLFIKGTTSQSANLVEWQNSAGTQLAYVDAAGVGKFENVGTRNGLGTLGYNQSGGYLNLTRANATMLNPGANAARIYVRAGTVSGLKLVVIAGAAGAETTILDNIPV